MSEAVPYADILILALIAVFILLRLRSVLGNRTGNENPDYFRRISALKSETQEPIVQLDEKYQKAKVREEVDSYMTTLGTSEVAVTLQAIKSRDPLFTASHFLVGARGAFEMVFDAFAKGDKSTLKLLLSDPIYQHFVGEIEDRKGQENKSETTLVSVVAKDITQATLSGNIARVSVRFESEQVTITRNPKGDIVEGDPSAIHHVEDEWMFERDVTSKNPNWKIIET